MNSIIRKFVQPIPLVILSLLPLSLEDAVALDATCESFLKACESRADAPAWQSLTEVKPNFKLEAVKAEGQFYTRMNDGDWKKSPNNIDDAERKFVDQVRRGTIKLSECKNEGSETIEGVDTIVISYRLEMPGAPAANAKLNVGKADGLPYAQSSAATRSSYRYKGVTAPKL